MPPKGPNKAEELLQRYAKERRERGGDVSLHPATRRLLQGEVTRQFGQRPRDEPGWMAWFSLWRGRFVLGGALTVVIIGGIVFLLNGPGPREAQQLAKANAPRTENEFFLQPELRMADNRKETVTPAAPRPIDAAKSSPRARGLAEDTVSETTVWRSRTAGESLAAAKDAKAAEQNVALYVAVNPEPAPTSTFNYSVSLALAPPPVTATNSAGSPAQLALSNNRFADDGVAGGLAIANQNSASAVTQLGSLAANSAPAGNAADRYSQQGQMRNGVMLADEVQLSKQFNSAAPGQQMANAPARAPQLNAPQAARPIVEPPASASFVVATAAPVEATEEKLKRSDALAVATAPQPTAAPAPTPAARYYRLGGAAPESRVAQRTATDALARKVESSDADAAVLTEFTVEQQGTTIRWREADGSVYEGSVNPAVALGGRFQAEVESLAERDTALKREKLAESKPESGSGGNEISFRLSGTNVTLKQVVTVNGRFAPVTNGAVLTAESASRRLALQPEPQRPGGAGAPQESLLMIEGTVRVGASNEQRFRAIRSPR